MRILKISFLCSQKAYKELKSCRTQIRWKINFAKAKIDCQIYFRVFWVCRNPSFILWRIKIEGSAFEFVRNQCNFGSRICSVVYWSVCLISPFWDFSKFSHVIISTSSNLNRSQIAIFSIDTDQNSTNELWLAFNKSF